MRLGAEIWKGRVVNYYKVSRADEGHFLAGDGESCDDYSYRLGGMN